MLFDSIKIKSQPVNDEDAVNLKYVGNKNDLNVKADNFVDAINLIKQDLDNKFNQSTNNPLLTQLDFIKGETFYDIKPNDVVTLTYPNEDTNFFSQIQVDKFVDSGETESFERWNFDTDTKDQWKLLKGDKVQFENGLVKFGTLGHSNGYSIIVSDGNGLDISKVNSISAFSFLGSDNLTNVKFLISNNEKASWINNEFKVLSASDVNVVSSYDKGFTVDELVNMSTENKQKLLEGATNTLDIAIYVGFGDDLSWYIDYLNIDIIRNGYWTPVKITGTDKEVELKKGTAGVDITNLTSENIDLKVVAILGKSST